MNVDQDPPETELYGGVTAFPSVNQETPKTDKFRYQKKSQIRDVRTRFSLLEPLGHGNYPNQPSTVSTCASTEDGLVRGRYVHHFSWVTVLTLIYYPLYWLGILYLLKFIFRNLPLKTTSRMVGRVARIRLPHWMREPVFRIYGWWFKVQMNESEYQDDLTKYDTISAFFQRRLASTARIVDSNACLVSPADGTVLSCGLVKAGHLEQVKGIFYSLNGLLGPNTWGNMTPGTAVTAIKEGLPQLRPVRSTAELNGEYIPCVTSGGLDYLPVGTVKTEAHAPASTKQERKRRKSACAFSHSLRLQDMMYAEGLLLSEKKHEIMENKKNGKDVCGRRKSLFLPMERKFSPLLNDLSVIHKQQTGLFHLLIYLAPGDYHRFHSPTDWSIFMRRHFPGKLYPVSPKFLPHCDGLYCVNERVAYIGRWEHGFFAYIAVGATNVGSIEVDLDPELITNAAPKMYTPWRSTSQLDNMNKQTNESPSTAYIDRYFEDFIPQTRGEHFGQFNFGSTVIIIFEAPLHSFQFTVKFGSHIKVGESVGKIHEDNALNL